MYSGPRSSGTNPTLHHLPEVAKRDRPLAGTRRLDIVQKRGPDEPQRTKEVRLSRGVRPHPKIQGLQLESRGLPAETLEILDDDSLDHSAGTGPREPIAWPRPPATRLTARPNHPVIPKSPATRARCCSPQVPASTLGARNSGLPGSAESGRPGGPPCAEPAHRRTAARGPPTIAHPPTPVPRFALRLP